MGRMTRSAALMLIAVSASLGAQVAPRTVSGSVHDSVGRPLEGAVIVLNPMDAMRAARTDAAGRFQFDRVNPGRYALRTTRIGSLPDERTIVVPEEGLQVSINAGAHTVSARHADGRSASHRDFRHHRVSRRLEGARCRRGFGPWHRASYANLV